MKKEKSPLRFFIDPIGNTLCVWLNTDEKEIISEMDDHENILMLGKQRKVLGFEKINFLPEPFFKQLKKSLGQRSTKQLKGKLAE